MKKQITKKQITDLIREEIKWCKKQPKAISKEVLSMQKGFVKGLKQVITLIKLV